MNKQSKPHQITVICPSCKKRLKGATTDMIGDTGVCPKCKTEFELAEDKKSSRTILHILLVPTYLFISFLIAAPLLFRHAYADYDIAGTRIISALLSVFNYPAYWICTSVNFPDNYVGYLALALALMFLWPLPVLGIRPEILKSGKCRMVIAAYSALLLAGLMTGIRLLYGNQ